MIKNEANKRKILITMLALLLLCMTALYGCGNKDKGTAEPSPEQKKAEEKDRQKQAAVAEPTGKNTEKDKTDKDKTKKAKAEKKRATADEDRKERINNKKTSAGKGKSKKTSAGRVKVEIRKNKNNKERKKQNAEKTSKKKKSKKKTNSKSAAIAKKEFCHLTIECKVLTGRDDIDPGTAGLLPGDGYIMEKKKIEVKSGDSVYSILNRAKTTHGFAVSVENTQFGKYIQGIAGIEEKVCGDESGWKYKVNGKYPSKSCSKISVKKGDKIVWTYVLKA